LVSERRPVRARDRGSRALRIFVSYRRDDAAAYAGRLYDALVDRFGPENVFIDIDTIELGSDFRDAIDSAISSYDVALALIGRTWTSATDAEGRRRLDDPDDVLRLELERTLAHGLVVIPVRVQGAAMPAEHELPPALAPLAARQGMELRDTAWRDDVARLTRHLERIAERKAARAAGPPQPPAAAPAARRRPAFPRWSRRRGLALALALAGAVAAVAVAVADVGDDGAPAAQGRLLAAIPSPLRTDCEPIDWGPAAALASVSCPGARLNANYHLFESDQVMSAWYELTREEAAIEPDSGACDAGTFRGEAPYAVDGATVGRYFCFVDSEYPELVWTDRRLRVGAEVKVWKGTGREAAESLLRQWRCCLQLQPS
jgi:hypothetical protein